MMIQIEWWSRYAKEDGMKIKKTWRRIWLGDADDEKNHDIAHMIMTIGDPYWAMIEIQLWWLWEIQIEWWSRSSLVMIQIEWWSRSSPLMMIQVEWWSRSSDDDLDWVMIQIQWWCPIMMIRIQWWWSRSRKEDGMKIKMTWRQYDLEMQMMRRSREEDQWWKLCR